MLIDRFLKHLTKKPTYDSFLKARVSIIDWIGYSIAGTKTKQAKPFLNIQKTFPKGNALNLFSKNKSSALLIFPQIISPLNPIKFL